ncbi:MAG: hypothetical protein MZV63_21410 [Marinilabiliales bacterium]|nr:hypothetical protein [Marinilabiliales bacterium]
MKPLNYLILLLCVIQLAGCQKKEVPAELQEQLDSIAAVMVPQHGEALCDINMVMEEGGSITVKGETNLPQAKEEILALLGRSGYSFTDSITVLPDPAVVTKPWGLITGECLQYQEQTGTRG